MGRASTCASVPWPSQSGSQCGGFDDTAAVSSQPATLEAASATTLPLSTHGAAAAASPLSPSPSEARHGHLTERTRWQRQLPLPRPASAPEPWPCSRPQPAQDAGLRRRDAAPGGFAVDPCTRRPCGRVGGFGVSSWVRPSACPAGLSSLAPLPLCSATVIPLCPQFHLPTISFYCFAQAQVHTALLTTSRSHPHSLAPSSPR